jgi:tetraacyldisaccharide 4'-kinase
VAGLVIAPDQREAAPGGREDAGAMSPPPRQDGPPALVRAAASLFGVAWEARRLLYQRGWLAPRRVPTRVVSVGNLTVGGTGKTPAVELAVRTLTGLGHRPAVISRGYRRRSRGVQVVADAASIRLEGEDAGDEPFLLARRLPGVPVVVGANRAEAVQVARQRFDVTAIVLDDGFQHRTLRKDLEIIMARARRPWGNGRLLPDGPLREPLAALARADLVVATGATSIGEASEVAAAVDRYAPHCPLLAARYAPVECWEAQRVRSIPLARLARARLVAFAGLAAHAGFHATLAELGVEMEAAIAFPDHHWYSERDLATLESRAAAGGIDGLVTTEKDWVRLRPLRPSRRPLYVVSVRLDLVAGQGEWQAAFERACPRR